MIIVSESPFRNTDLDKDFDMFTTFSECHQLDWHSQTLGVDFKGDLNSDQQERRLAWEK